MTIDGNHMSTILEPISPQSWKGSDIDWRDEGLYVLSADDLLEIDAALSYQKSLGQVDFSSLTVETFPLERMRKTLRSLSSGLRTGPGFSLLRGLDVGRYSRDDMARIFYGLGLNLGEPIIQSHQGELLGHVMDLSDIEATPRGYHTGGHMGMHTDSCDIVGLMCLRSAVSGGASRICSAPAVLRAIEVARPDLAAVMAQGFVYRRMDDDARFGSGIVLSPNRIPVFVEEEHSFSCYYVGGYIRRAERSGDVSLSAEEREALEEITRLTESPEFYLDMQFSDGDIQFLNNRTIFHGRTDYQDGTTLLERRHLLRLWLRVPTWMPYPKAQVFHSAEDRKQWGVRRTPLMEMPSTYLAKKAAEFRQ